MILKKEVEHIAKLARIDLTEKEIRKYQKELSLILDYFQVLNKADIKDIKLSGNLAESESILREDILKKQSKAKSDDLLALAPKIKNRFLKVRRILE